MPTHSFTLPSALLLVVCFSSVHGTHAAAETTPTTDELLHQAGEYVRSLEGQIAMVVSDETYRQTVEVGSPRRRTIQSEMLYWWLPDERAWLSVRSVLKVDGHSVPDSMDRLERVLREPAMSDGSVIGESSREPLSQPAVVARSSRLRALQEEAGRFDLAFDRTTGNPTQVLQFVLPENQHHFAFTREHQERMRGLVVWKIAFTEQGRPAVVIVNNEPALSSGAIWVRASDGTIVRTNLSLASPGQAVRGRRQPSVSVTVDFERDSRLAMWVPTRMHEQYPGLRCTSTYTNFRRFETLGRLVLPKP